MRNPHSLWLFMPLAIQIDHLGEILEVYHGWNVGETYKMVTDVGA
jgi:hypothetical protein